MTNNNGTPHERYFTPIQRKILAALSDGMVHSRDELKGCLEDSQANYNDLQQHLSKMRKILRPAGMEILCCLHNRGIHYRMVRLISAGTD